MKILFAIQGTGNGHLSRARDVYPALAQYGQVDVLVSGIQADVQVPFPIKYTCYGMSFIFGKKGGVDMLQTAKKLKLFRLIKDIRSLPVKDYDLIINDFEPVSSWACRINKVPCISLSHQAAVLHPLAPKPPKKDWMGYMVLKYYAPVSEAYGIHFANYAPNIFTPVIRHDVRNLTPSDLGHYTVYLPAYNDDALVKHLSHFRDVQWQVFSKHNSKPFVFENVNVQPIENNAFLKSMASSSGLLCGAGFEGPAEAMFLGKKVLVIPMTAQYEQHCNAAGAATLGASVIQMLDERNYPQIARWLSEGTRIHVNFPDHINDIVKQIITKHAPKKPETEIKTLAATA